MTRISNIYENLRDELAGEKLRLDECEYVFEPLSELLVGEAGFARYSKEYFIYLQRFYSRE